MCQDDPHDVFSCLTSRGNLDHRKLSKLYRWKYFRAIHDLGEERKAHAATKDKLDRLEGRTRTKEEPLRLVG